MTEKQLRWLQWLWRVAFASYVAGVLTMFQAGSIIVFWGALLFTPLLVLTLFRTRSSLIAWVGIPVVAATLAACVHLILALRETKEVPQSPMYLAIWFFATLGPIVLYIVVSRDLSHRLKSVAVPKQKDI